MIYYLSWRQVDVLGNSWSSVTCPKVAVRVGGGVRLSVTGWLGPPFFLDQGSLRNGDHLWERASWASAHFMRNGIFFLALVFLCYRTFHECCHAHCQILCFVPMVCSAFYEMVLCVILKLWFRVLCFRWGNVLSLPGRRDNQHQNCEITVPGTGPQLPVVVASLTSIRILSGVCSTTCHLKSGMDYIA